MKEEQELFIYDYGVPIETEKANNPVTRAWLKALGIVWMYIV